MKLAEYANTEIEQRVLGAIITNREAIDRVAYVLSPSDFLQPDHRSIYEAMLNLYEKDRVIDRLTLKDELTRSGAYVQAGEHFYLTHLEQLVSDIGSLEGHVDLLREKTNMRRLTEFSKMLAERIESGSQEFDALMKQAEDELFTLTDAKRTLNDPPLSKIIERVIATYDAEHASGKVSGVRTGFSTIDYYTSGLKPGHLWTVGGSTGMGKTSFSLQLALNAASAGANVLFFSLEMIADEIGEKLLCNLAEVDTRKLTNRCLNQEENERVAKAEELIRKLPQIELRSAFTATPSSLRATARRIARQKPLDVIIVDFIQRIYPEKRYESRHLELTATVKVLRELGHELNACVVGLSQLRKPEPGAKNKRPTIYDLRDSGSIADESNVILLLYREGYYDHTERDTTQPEDYEVEVAKCRGGVEGRTHLAWYPFNQRFINWGE